MMISWLFYVLVVSAAVTGSAVAFDVAGRMMRWPRRVGWALALGAVMILPLGMSLLNRALGAVRPVPSQTGAGIRLPAITVTGALAPPSASGDALLLAALIGAATVGAVTLIVAHRRLRRAAHAWRSDSVDGVAVRISSAVGPAVFGWLRPVIVLPEWVTTLDASERLTILAHETEHVKAFDSLLLNAARVVLSLVPWNPFAWIAYRRLQLAVEFDCDRRVLARGANALAYADTLLTVSRRATVTAPALRVALTEPTSFLSRRISAMLSHQPRSPRLIAAGATMAGLLLLVVACVTREPVGTASGGQTVHQVPEVVVVGARGGSTPSPVAGPIVVPANQPFFEFQVEQKAMPIAGNAAPHYPDSLRVAGIEGEVLAQFVVNDDGIPDVQSLKVLRATRTEFAEAVRTALPGLRFSPARVGDRAVRQLVQQPFVFSVTK